MGRWRVQVRRKGRPASETILRHDDARDWAAESERAIDRGAAPLAPRAARTKTFDDLVDLRIDDIYEVGKAPGRSKHATLTMLKRRLGRKTCIEVDREWVVSFGRERAREGAGPTTLGIDVGVIKRVLQHATAVHGLPVSVEQVNLGRIALKRLGLVDHRNERGRRPTEKEVLRLIDHFDSKPR